MLTAKNARAAYANGTAEIRDADPAVHHGEYCV